MIRTTLLVLACTLAAFTARAADEENPLKTAKVGDWISYSSATKMAGFDMQSEMKQTVIKKTDDEATIEIVAKVQGQEIKQTQTVNLKEKYDPRKMSMPGTEVQIKELGTGEEEIEVGGKKMKTKWTQYEITGNSNGVPMNVKGKSWVSKDVPLGGMVKSESEIQGMGKTTVVLKDFGRGQ